MAKPPDGDPQVKTQTQLKLTTIKRDKCSLNRIIYYAFKLSKETKNERYWLALAFSAIFLAIHQWTMIPWGFHIVTDDIRFVIQEISSIIGSIIFGYAVYGLFTSMKKIRKRLE